jgi:hypothetical protein
MSDRVLSSYMEERNPEGPYWSIEAERSASGEPTVLFTIHFRGFDDTLADDQMTVVVHDVHEFLAPINQWLRDVHGLKCGGGDL